MVEHGVDAFGSIGGVGCNFRWVFVSPFQGLVCFARLTQGGALGGAPLALDCLYES
jgi:hypothetical protein